MHLLHLAIYPDVICGILCDLTDHTRTRDQELNRLWDNYKTWCDEQGVPDRAARKLFTSDILKPKAREYASISQKQLSATAARYFIFWLAHLMSSFMQANPGNEFYESLVSKLRGPDCIAAYSSDTVKDFFFIWYKISGTKYSDVKTVSCMISKSIEEPI